MLFQISTHYVLLEHYYSVDFPLWFDRKFFALAYFEKQQKKFVKLESERGYSNDLTDFLSFAEEVVLKSVFKSTWRANPWMDFVHFFSIISVLSLILCRTNCFHREWLALIRICVILTLKIQGNFKTMYILLKRSHSRWKGLDLQQIEWKRN